MSKEVMQQALDVLQRASDAGYSIECYDAIEALTAELAKTVIGDTFFDCDDPDDVYYSIEGYLLDMHVWAKPLSVGDICQIGQSASLPNLRVQVTGFNELTDVPEYTVL